MTTEIPEGYEPAENSAAKDVAQETLYEEFVAQDVYLDEGDDYTIDLVSLADKVVEALLKAGVTIPESLNSPFGDTAH